MADYTLIENCKYIHQSFVKRNKCGNVRNKVNNGHENWPKMAWNHHSLSDTISAWFHCLIDNLSYLFVLAMSLYTVRSNVDASKVSNSHFIGFYLMTKYLPPFCLKSGAPTLALLWWHYRSLHAHYAAAVGYFRGANFLKENTCVEHSKISALVVIPQ